MARIKFGMMTDARVNSVVMSLQKQNRERLFAQK